MNFCTRTPNRMEFFCHPSGFPLCSCDLEVALGQGPRGPPSILSDLEELTLLLYPSASIRDAVSGGVLAWAAAPVWDVPVRKNTG